MENNFELEVTPSTLLNLNKQYISEVVEKARLALNDGFSDPLMLFITAKKGQELFTQLEKTVRPFAEQDIRLSSGETYKKFGCDITERVTGASYDFSVCNDSVWNDLKIQINTLTEGLKAREKFLKTLSKPMADPETGEVINPPIHKGRLGLSVSIK